MSMYSYIYFLFIIHLRYILSYFLGSLVDQLVAIMFFLLSWLVESCEKDFTLCSSFYGFVTAFISKKG